MLKKIRLLLKAFFRACAYRFFLCVSKQESLILYSASTKDLYGNISSLAAECDKRHIPYVTLSYEEMRTNLYASLALLATARVLVIDANSPAAFVRLSEKTTLVNCWHACGAYKKVAFDAKQKGKRASSEEKRIARIHRCISYFICSSPYTASVYRAAFHLRDSQVLSLGTPRTDVLHALAANSEKPDIITILYAPTFRTRATKRALPNVPDIKTLRACLEKGGLREVRFCLRMHPTVAEEVFATSKENVAFVGASEWENWSELPYETVLRSASLLITDYSSIFFDYLFFKRPVLFYVPDLDVYQEEERELYVSPYHLFPDGCATSEEELGQKILALFASGDADAAAVKRFELCATEVWNTYMASCDGHSCERIVTLLQALMRGNT